jgi:hypothetical protein
MFKISMADITLYLSIWQALVTIFTLIITILSIIKYKKKKNKMAKYLLIAFIFVFFAGIFQTTATFRSYFEWDTTTWPYGDIAWVYQYFYYQWEQYQYAYYCLVIGVFFLFLFSLEIVAPDKKMMTARFLAVFFMIIIIGYGIFGKENITWPENDVVDILKGVDVWVAIYVITLMTPTLVETLRLRKRLSHDDPTRKRLLYIALFALSVLILILCFILETIWGIFTNEWTNPMSFAAWIFAILALLTAYNGLYRK